jgi:RsiW-degrading membrane proteinase PrsW (M82 family)
MRVVQVLVSLAPVLAFAAGLYFLDSYKLVRVRTVLGAIGVGFVVAGAAFAFNTWVLDAGLLPPRSYSRFVAPVLEELLKGAYIIYLIRRQKVGFMVDAAVCGFAVGAGFACIENLYYLYALEEASLLLWVIRGFGTAVMHGGATNLLAIMAKNLSDRWETHRWLALLPGYGAAVSVHALFNWFILPPTIATLVLMVSLPPLVLAVFASSEKALKNWLGVGFDSDLALLEMIRSGRFLTSRLGRYLSSLRSRLPGEVLADILCYLRLHVELAMRAKSLLLMREAGFEVAPDEDTRRRFDELRYLEKSIGATGKLAVMPLLRTSSRDLWQLQLLLAK